MKQRYPRHQPCDIGLHLAVLHQEFLIDLLNIINRMIIKTSTFAFYNIIGLPVDPPLLAHTLPRVAPPRRSTQAPPLPNTHQVPQTPFGHISTNYGHY